MANFAGRYDEAVLVRSGGALLPGANYTAYVYESDGETLATLYTDRTKATEQDNPLEADAEGNLEFFAEPGDHVLKIYNTSGALVRTDSIVVPIDPRDPLPVRISDTPPASPQPNELWLDTSGDALTYEGDFVFNGSVQLSDGGEAISETAANGAYVGFAEARTIPVTNYLPGGYVAGTTDIAPYVEAAMADLEGGSRATVLLPAGTCLWNSSVYLDLASRDLSYEIVGHGKGTTVNLGSGLDGDYAIYANETSGGSKAIQFPRHPRLRVTDLFVTLDGGATNPSWCWSNEASVHFERLRFKDILNGLEFEGSGYTDLVKMETISWETPVSGGWLLQTDGNGDGLVLEQITATGSAQVASLTNTAGATIRACIGGTYTFASCDRVEVIGHHYDSKLPGSYATVPAFTIQSSNVTFRGAWDHIAPGQPVYVVNDIASKKGSSVVWEDCFFGFRNDEPGKQRAAHIDIEAVSDFTNLAWRNCRGIAWSLGNSNRYPTGILVTSDVAGVQSAIDAHPQGPLGNNILRLTDQGWVIGGENPAATRRFVRTGTPQLNASATNTFDGDLVDGTTYYYRVATYDDIGRDLHSANSAEASVTPSGVNLSVSLGIDAKASPTLVRVWRGTSTGSYDRYVDITVGNYSTNLFDTGDEVSGFPWITTGVPSASLSRTSMDGYLMGGFGRWQGDGAPSSGTWARGDSVTDVTPSAGAGASEWKCTAGGTPGTWKSTGGLSA